MLACPKTATEKSGKRRGEIPPQTPFRPACLAEQGLGWEASPMSWYQDIKTKHFSIPFRRKGGRAPNLEKEKNVLLCTAELRRAETLERGFKSFGRFSLKIDSSFVQ